MDCAKILTIIAATSLLISGCADGFLEVSPEHNAPTPDAGIGDDVGANGNGGGDVGNGGDDVGNGDDAGTNQNNNDTPVCCTVGTIECVDDHAHRECLAGDDDCGQWADPTTCPNNELCDDRDGAEELCTACRDDDFAPDNFVSQTAPTLSAGTTFSDLVLCDNGNPDVTSHNFFYLGQISTIDVHLQWVEEQGPLGLDFWTAEAADSSWAGRDYLADAGQHPSELSHNQSLGSNTHIFARVYFRTSSPPTAGTTYTISHAN